MLWSLGSAAHGVLTGWMLALIIWLFLLDLYLPLYMDPSLDGGVPEWVLRVRDGVCKGYIGYFLSGGGHSFRKELPG